MKNKILKICSLLLLLLFLPCFSITAYAELGYTEYILDPESFHPYGDRLEENNARAKEISNLYNVVISFALIEDIGDRDPMEIADSVYMNAFGGYDGVLFIQFYNQSKTYINTYGKADELFGDDEKNQIVNSFNEAVYYDDCISNYLETAASILKLKTGSMEFTPSADVGPDAIPKERQNLRFVDEAGLLNKTEKAELLDKLDEISERQQVDVVLVTMPDFDGKTPQAFADDFFDYEGYGYGENDDGILFAIDMTNRKWAISTYGYGITAFTDNGQRYMTDKFLPSLSNGEYDKAFHTYADLCDELISMAKDGKPYNKSPNGTDASFWILWIPVSLGIGFAISFILARRHSAKLTTVRTQTTAKSYTHSSDMSLNSREDVLLNSNVSRQALERQTSSGHSGGGSSTHTSSSGRSHGGSSGSF